MSIFRAFSDIKNPVFKNVHGWENVLRTIFLEFVALEFVTKFVLLFVPL